MIPSIYRRIEQASDLPPPNAFDTRARERHDIDFKTFADETKSWEHAKDIAAFANALGGVIVVGADAESQDRLTYPGLRGQSIADVKRIYETAAHLCSPTAAVDVLPIELAGGSVVVAVNVEPSPEQLVAARAGTRNKNGVEQIHGDAWVFPIRRASQTEFIKPEKLPMYMSIEVRRAVLLLARIPAAVRRELTVHFHTRTPVLGGVLTTHVVQMKSPLALDEVSVDANRAQFVERGSCELRVNVPLRDILNVWESREGHWDVLVSGEIQREKGAQHDTLKYAPLPR